MIKYDPCTHKEDTMHRISSMPTVLAAVLLITACAPQRSPTLENRAPDFLALINTYQESHNRSEVERALAMFSPDARFEVVGMGTMPDLDSIRALHHYDVGIQAQVEFSNCIVEDSIVTCEAREQNDWLKTAGLGSMFYPSSVFTFNPSGKITRIVATMSPDGARALGEVLSEFGPWLHTDRPEAAARLFTDDGLFVYSEENGRLVVQMLREWRGSE